MVGRRRLLDLHHVKLVLVGARLQVRAVGVQHPAIDHAVPDRLAHDLVKDPLIDRGVGVAPAAILREGRGVRHLVGQAEAGKPAVGDIDLHLAHQLPLAAHPEQVADEQQLEHHHRIECRASVVGAVQVRDLGPDELEIDRSIDLAQQVIGRHQRFQRHHLQLVLVRGRRLEHHAIMNKASRDGEALSAIRKEGFFFHRLAIRRGFPS